MAASRFVGLPKTVGPPGDLPGRKSPSENSGFETPAAWAPGCAAESSASAGSAGPSQIQNLALPENSSTATHPCHLTKIRPTASSAGFPAPFARFHRLSIATGKSAPGPYPGKPAALLQCGTPRTNPPAVAAKTRPAPVPHA